MAKKNADTAQDVLINSYAVGPNALKTIQGSDLVESGTGDSDGYVTPTSGTIDLTQAAQANRRLEFAPTESWELLAVYLFFSTTQSRDITVQILRGTSVLTITTDSANADTGWRMKVGSMAFQGAEAFTKDYKLRIDFTQTAGACAVTPFVIWRRIP